MTARVWPRGVAGESAVGPASGALGQFATPAGKLSRHTGAQWGRKRWWPWFLAVGGLLTGVGATLLSGSPADWAVGVGAAIIFIMAIWSSVSPMAGDQQLVFHGMFSIAVGSLPMTPADCQRQPPALHRSGNV